MRLGVDVSEYQRGIDLDGLDFAVIRTTDGDYRDTAFPEHAAAAGAAGLDTAAYHFLRAPSEGTPVAAQVEASVAVLGAFRPPMWLDVESPAGLSLADVRAAHRCFTAAGVEVAGVYTTAAYWRRHMLLADPREFGQLWLAAWGDNPAVDLSAPGYGIPAASAWPHPLGLPTPSMWQFTSRGLIGGVEVDLNLAW